MLLLGGLALAGTNAFLCDHASYLCLQRRRYASGNGGVMLCCRSVLEGIRNRYSSLGSEISHDFFLAGAYHVVNSTEKFLDRGRGRFHIQRSFNACLNKCGLRRSHVALVLVYLVIRRGTNGQSIDVKGKIEREQIN